MQIIPFNYESKEIRVIQHEDGKPWWVPDERFGFVNSYREDVLEEIIV